MRSIPQEAVREQQVFGKNVLLYPLISSSQSPLRLGTPVWSSLARSLAPPLQITPALLGCDLVIKATLTASPHGEAPPLRGGRGTDCTTGTPFGHWFAMTYPEHCTFTDNLRRKRTAVTPQLVVAKSAPSRDSRLVIPRSLPCSSSPNHTRFAEL